MTEREKLYSCILHQEVEERGRELNVIASCLDISYQKGYRLMKAYNSSYENYNVLRLTQIAKMKTTAHKVLACSRAKARYVVEKRKKYGIIDHAFHMPITVKEKRVFNAIAALVARDEYLSEGYRKPKDYRQRIIDNPNKYKY